MKNFKNIKKKEATLLILTYLSMSSAQAMEEPHDINLTEIRKSSAQPMEEMEIDKKITNLRKAYDTAIDFYNKTTKGYMSPTELEKTLHELYGKSDTFLCFPWNERGLLNNLWETQTVFKSWYPGYQEEVPGELQGFAHRMARTNNPHERKRIRELHTETLQYVTEAILQSNQNVVRVALNNDEKMKRTYELQQKHMKEIYTHKDDYDWLDETENHDYRSWFERPLKFVGSPHWTGELRVQDLFGLLEKNEIGITTQWGRLQCFFINDTQVNPTDEVQRHNLAGVIKPKDLDSYYQILGRLSEITGELDKIHGTANISPVSISLTNRKDFGEKDRINLLNWVSEFFPHYREGNSPQNKSYLLNHVIGDIGSPTKKSRPPAPLPSPSTKIEGLGHDEWGMVSDNNRTTPSRSIEPLANIEKRLNGDNIISLPHFSVALAQEEEGLHALANHNYHLAYENQANEEFRSMSTLAGAVGGVLAGSKDYKTATFENTKDKKPKDKKRKKPKNEKKTFTNTIKDFLKK